MKRKCFLKRVQIAAKFKCKTNHTKQPKTRCCTLKLLKLFQANGIKVAKGEYICISCLRINNQRIKVNKSM